MNTLAKRHPSQTHRVLTADDIEALAVGAWILGTGGGGDPYHKLLNMRLLYEKGHQVTLIDPMSLTDDALVAVLSNMGAPLVGQERLADPDFAIKPLRMMEEHLGRKFDAVMALEIGGGNGMHPMQVAAIGGYPVVDADTMGRAYPEAQMTSVAVAGLRCYPLTMADIRDNEIIFPRAASWRWMERISRKACTEIGSVAATCKAPRSGAEVKQHGILYSVSKAIDLGQQVRAARAAHADPIEAVLGAAQGKLLFTGKVVDVERRATEGFLRGQARIEGLNENAGQTLVVHFQNEYSVAFLDAEPVVMTPDLICLLDTVSGEGIGTDVLRFGQRVSVLALPAPEVFLTEAGLSAVGPRAFGFDLDFTSVFKGEQA
ncbi:DUF917 domain-containing protein [Tropicimonas sp. IMCC6043]|uniref:DUF917 domain-containing protein n=1 Tax=Tropicimonas sp. IMCC6043 TaxID=2510645 RepID=UPI00101B7BE3|nr:DUF917 domain-containing protein [Tropicimonas sp. IMCC6043]RYH12317.1 DUF917 domain-containing protein [Tropicimonas sp. IMCC6043]